MRKTKHKEKLIHFLENATAAFTAQEIYERIDDIDLSTVYRNLNSFAEEGIVKELRINKGKSIYEINKDSHEHAICSQCGKIRHVYLDKEKLKKQLNLKGFSVDDIEVNIRGYCNNSCDN